MADKISPEQRSNTMRAVKSKNTKPEMVVRRLLHSMGYRYRLHRRDLPGKPDIVLPRYRKVIFVHGCFWHGHSGCRQATRPTSNTDYWNAKLAGNIERDQDAVATLKGQGWDALIIWECHVKNAEFLRERLEEFLKPA